MASPGYMVSGTTVLDPANQSNNMAINSGTATGTITAGTSGTISLTNSSLSSGATVVVAVALSSTTVTVSSITDGAGLTYTKRAAMNSSTTARVELWMASSSSTIGANNTITVNLSASGTTAMIGFTVSNSYVGSPEDQTMLSSASGTGTAVTLTSSTTNPTTMVVAAVAWAGGSGASWTKGASYTNITSVTNSTTIGCGAEYLVLSASGSQTPNATLGISEAWAEVADAINLNAPNITTVFAGSSQEWVVHNMYSNNSSVYIGKVVSNGPVSQMFNFAANSMLGDVFIHVNQTNGIQVVNSSTTPAIFEYDGLELI